MKYLFLFLLASCSGIPAGTTLESDASTSTGGNSSAGGTTSVCNQPDWTSTIGFLPESLPNQISPGYIVAIIANGGSVLQVTYQPSSGVSTTVPISIGKNSNIGITGTWEHDGNITSLSSNNSSFTINSSVFIVSGATVSGSGIWSGLNSGVGLIDGEDNTLNFSGYNANSGIQSASLEFTVICSK